MNARALLRRQLDARLTGLPRDQPPSGGWIRAIRTALGMTMAQLGKRLGISAPAVADLEKREASEAISVARLRRAADALDCDLLIAVVPRTSLDEMVRRQASLKATREQDRLLHTMKLEQQEHGVNVTADLDRTVERMLDTRAARVWD